MQHFKEERKALHKSLLKAKRQDRKRTFISLKHEKDTLLSDYYFHKEFRWVYPYWFTFTAYAKRRWIGHSLVDILSSEFRSNNEELVMSRCQSGLISVNGKAVEPDYVIKDSDKITHRVHRHELPVLRMGIEILHEDENILVINKPPSIPVHACGKYNINSLVHILAKDYGIKMLRFCNRLDRCTCYVCIPLHLLVY
ncbi:unnamed protein product [Protopolystoma xenopodis]|uniref:Uncharacterized protein n=1 Tax=Protopolystoma xenopodis TaxID=117903 RepID=A0A448X8Q6_9PLAT|nr:unnamed protein product [Protopolystoma xenopodis]